jgi:hypothetical protein
MNKSIPRVLVAAPIIYSLNYKNYTIPQFFETIKRLTYKNKKIYLKIETKNGEYKSFLKKIPSEFETSKQKKEKTVIESIVKTRNAFRKKTLTEGYDYLLLIEQDILPPLDIIEKLLANKKEICSALYFNIKRDGNRADCLDGYNPMAWNYNTTTNGELIEKSIPFEELFPGRLIQVAGVGLGCILISRKVLEKIKFRFIKNEKWFEEFYFAEDCKKNKIPIYLDTQIVCRHYTRRMLDPQPETNKITD